MTFSVLPPRLGSLIALICGLALTGCTTYWTKAGFTDQEFRADTYSCERDMRQSGYYGGGLVGVLNARSFHDRCMEAKGYRQARESSPPPAPEPVQCPDGTYWSGVSCRSETTRPSTSTPVAAASGLDGTFSGEITGQARGQAFTMRVTFTLVQSGDQVVGVWHTATGTSGTVQGVVSGGQVPDFRVKQVNPCEGAFAGVAVIESGRHRGSYAGVDCNGPATASFVMTRQ